MRAYKCLTKQTYTINEFQIVPIRDQDKYDIMKWRNEQLYHLRQTKPLDEVSQDNYFDNVISKLFEKKNPDQILFSYLENGICIGYGGLVHINWIDRNAEISFLIDPKREETQFKLHWGVFLRLIETVAFSSINLKKIYTYAFNIRPKLFQALSDNGYLNEAELKEHVLINSIYFSVLIHSKFNSSKI